VLSNLENITREQIGLILKEEQAMPVPEYRDACLKARIAASQLRKPTWSIYSMAHVNALLLGLNKIKYSESYSVMKLISMAECFSFGLMGQDGLSYEDFNLAIGPLASVLSPELFAEKQTWTIEPVPKSQFASPFRPTSYRTRKPRSERAKGDDESDVLAAIDKLVKDAGGVRPAAIQVPEADPDEVLKLMMKGINNP
jgi:hypothetical protein